MTTKTLSSRKTFRGPRGKPQVYNSMEIIVYNDRSYFHSLKTSPLDMSLDDLISRGYVSESLKFVMANGEPNEEGKSQRVSKKRALQILTEYPEYEVWSRVNVPRQTCLPTWETDPRQTSYCTPTVGPAQLSLSSNLCIWCEIGIPTWVMHPRDTPSRLDKPYESTRLPRARPVKENESCDEEEERILDGELGFYQ